MTDIIDDLDTTLTGGLAAELAEEYPDASERSIETAKQIEKNRRRIEAAAEAIERKKQQRKKRLERKCAELVDTIERTERQVAALAASAGRATDEEKQLLKEAAAEGGRGTSDLGTYFDPDTNGGTH